MKNKLKIVIVAGGTGSRFGDLNIFPKILLPIDAQNTVECFIDDIFKFKI